MRYSDASGRALTTEGQGGRSETVADKPSTEDVDARSVGRELLAGGTCLSQTKVGGGEWRLLLGESCDL